MTKLFGLIGFPLSHSFSKSYFNEKFKREKIKNCYYELFPLDDIDLLPGLLLEYPELAGLNVTIPYKEKVLSYLDDIDASAAEVGAVNTVKITGGNLKGYNTDVYGFQKTLMDFVPTLDEIKALVLGTGGAAKAVVYAFQQMNVPFLTVSRNPNKGDLIYKDLTKEHLMEYPLIVNTTPLGMAPNTDSVPPIPYKSLGSENFLYDLVYNPKKTVFLLKGEKKGSATLNGLPMLHYQAEKAWEIWNSN